MEAFLTSTALVTVAEIGDKTQLLSFVLAARLRRPWPILAGILVATVLNHTLAGLAGYALSGVVPRSTLIWIVGLAFIGFGLWALHPDSLRDDLKPHRAGAFVTSVIAFFMAEMADKTQLATVALAARYPDLVQVIIGTTLGMMIANVPAVWVGEKLAERMPVKAVRLIAAALFIGIGAVTLLGPVSDSL